MVVDHNRYSVPTAYVGFKVRTLVDVSHVRIYYAQKELASHERVYGKDKWILSVWHYVDLLRQRPQAFDSARPLKHWREQWPPSLEALLERFCQSQGRSRGIKDFISVLLLYRDYPAAAVEAAVETALDARLSCADGVKHLLQYSQAGPVIESLSQWPSLPAADVSVYSQLQAAAAAPETGGER